MQQVYSGSGAISSATDEKAEAPVVPMTSDARMDISPSGTERSLAHVRRWLAAKAGIGARVFDSAGQT